jgi:hypothetical protein
MVQCTYCNKDFSTKSSLGLHKRTAIYCLKIQGNVESNRKYICVLCNAGFSIKHGLDRHTLSNCPMNTTVIVDIKKTHESELDDLRIEMAAEIDDLRILYDIKLDKKDNKIQRLKSEMCILRDKYLLKEGSSEIYEDLARQNQKIIEEIAKQPKNTTNTNNNNNLTINNAVSLAPDDLKAGIIDKFTGNTLIGGPKEFAQICVDYVTDDDGETMYPCTDTNRGTFWHRLEDGSVIKDVGAIELIKSVRGAGLKGAVNKSASELVERGLELEEVNTYRRKFDEDGKYSREFNGQFRKHFAASTSVV